MMINNLLRRNSATYVQIFCGLVLLGGLFPKATHGQTTTGPTTSVSIGLGLEEPPVRLELAPLSAQASLEEYRRLGEKIGVREEEKLVIMVLTLSNLVEVPMETEFGELVPITGKDRRRIVAYLSENPETGRPAYTLPTGETVVRIPPKASMVLRLAFLVDHGEHAVFEKSLRIFACFSHELLGGVRHSLAWSSLTQQKQGHKTLEKAPSTEANKDGVRQEPLTVEFEIAESLTPEAVRLLRFPTSPLSRGGPSIYVESFLGERGKDSKYPYWFNICLAVGDGKFDYATAVRYLHLLAVYKSTYPSGLARNAVWLEDPQGVLLTPTAHRVYVASSVWGICTLPHDAAEVLLYLISEALMHGIDPTDLVPLPGTYKSVTSDGHKGFELGLSGVSLKAISTGVGFEITLVKRAGVNPNAGEPLSLSYIRKRIVEE